MTLNITSATTTSIGISNTGAFGNLSSSLRFYTTSGTKIVGTYDSSYPTFIRFVGGSNTGFEITNISIVEVQGDRPRLSYDITNGVVEDKTHLLLKIVLQILLRLARTLVKSHFFTIYNEGTNHIKSPNGLIKGNLWLANATSDAKELQEQYSVTSGTTFLKLVCKIQIITIYTNGNNECYLWCFLCEL